MAISKTEICYYAMYVICEVESNWNWGAVYYTDPITIGISQCYAYNAARLLNKLKDQAPDNYAKIAASLRADVESHDANSQWWTSRYLTQYEGNTWIEAAKDDVNHRIQEADTIEEYGKYIDILVNKGFSMDNPKPLIFAMSMWHQSPKSASRVISTAGGTATLDRIYQVCLNDSVLGKYRTRYNTNYNRLKAWDGVSAPPDFGQTGDVESGGDPGGIGVDANQIGYVLQVGDCLVIFGTGTYRNGVVCYPASGQRWVPGFNANGTDISGNTIGQGSATGSAGQQAVVSLYKSWEGRFVYSQAAGRLDPISSGYGDCSSTIWFAYKQATGVDVGTWTGAMASKGRLIAKGSGGTLPLSSMQLGDLVIFFSGSISKHVEMYTGPNELYGHGGGSNGSVKGPTRKDAQAYCAATSRTWQVRRYL